LVATTLAMISTDTAAMGLRSFVALPLEKNGTVLRLFDVYNFDRDINGLTTSLAYGLSGKQTLFLSLPYRISPSGPDRFGDVNLLYRHVVWQVDDNSGTSRLGLLGGVAIPTDKRRDVGAEVGAVATFYHQRHEWDLDALWVQGLDNAPNAARYDVSWQYRLTPAHYPEWGQASEWDVVLELNGRWAEGGTMVHQVTIGLQWIHRRWVLEGGFVQDLNGPQESRLLVGTRIHF